MDEIEDLTDLCLQIAATLYPDTTPEGPSMVMSNVYEHLTEHGRDYTKADQSIVRWFADTLSDPANAIMCVGRLR